ncbi:LuxR C-terminal-related transcriptional regulator [Polaromonas sp. YR568]|uniref:LuxR C-terminal-related transcriptional regulator n=1 Tax=Polaromonas sp. YR568 TaxID=1855301 RepID=UPI00398BD782
MQSSSTPSLIHVALVEDDVHFQNAIVTAIAASPDIRLMSLASTRAQGLQSLESAPADVLLVDLGLPDGSGIDVIHAAHTLWPTCAVMVCTAFGDEAHVLQSIEAGASGYLLKDSEPENMLHEIRSLHGGGSPISPLIARQILMRFRAAPAAIAAVPTAPAATPAPAAGEHAVLSAREKEVLELITKGFTADEIARLMQVSQHTVQTYVRRIYSKLNVNSRAEAIYEARHQGILAA